jgi:hypothetical protein
MEPSIELSKTRDFGEIISDSFLFIRQNFKPLLSCFFVFCGFFLFAGTVVSIMQQIKMVDVANNPNGGIPGSSSGVWAAYGLETLFTAVFALLGFMAIIVTVISFMALYKAKGNIAPTNEELWGYFKYYFLKILGGAILNYILVVIGFMFCIVPGIYLYPVLGLVFPIIIVENTSYSYAFNQSFRLIKENWWTIFGALFITGLIVSICASVVTVPFQVVNIWSVFLHQIKTPHLSILSIVMGTILTELAQAFYILPVVTLGICYFSLAETKDATGLLDRINQLGTNQADTNASAEEY